MSPRIRWLVLVGLLAVGACGVRTDDGVEVADPDDVPFGLLEPDRVPIAGPGPAAAAVIDVYFFDPDEEQMVPVTRRVDTADVATVVEELEAGPSDAESGLGLRSALSDVDAVSTIEVDEGTATIDLAESFTELSGSDQLTAVAQLVLSLTRRPAVDQVVITVDGKSVEVPRGDGTLTTDPLDASDYDSLVLP